MGLSFKKIGRGIRKIAKKNAKGAGRLVRKFGPGLITAAVLPTAAPLIAGAASKLKTAGKKIRGLETPKSMVDVVKLAEVKVGKKRSKMPGGASMPSVPNISRPNVGMMASTPQAKRSLYTSSKKRKSSSSSDVYTRGKNKGKKRRKITAPPSAKQLAQREKFKAMAAARRKKAA